ncbi:gamma-glutamyl-gamma-aminobutyrate hydrolase family protein [Pseudohoeflea coraliihabitans]|uniref:Gamma-glutamyl-gamma-aminobutyrate hydrolase family protein n=1 Tax=Pseudohoeflea coraliihabitans TaxID=2860393 RepID=A0ABS6WM66_9HYPH|nr:gamma-glutamyl-gamma-aminobutyrate hydrolase family protein [Pseudohoeflea sp. DP4N28-3]MBW3097056.1 gamma-glutamyl-gamma-aminobutyrate hydrolase family protein [Pseudohoeflea sp. DP4N28-3]
MSRPLVGVTTSVKGSLTSWWFNALAVWRAGGKPLRLTASSRERPQLDALIVGGGDDISASLYDGKIVPEARFDADRDRLEQDMLDRADARGIPVLGICRGAQMINVHRGGGLHQEISTVWPEAPTGRQLLPRKMVTIESPSRLARLFEVKRLKVNSLHHQAIDRLGEGLHVVAHDEFGIVQAIESTTNEQFVLGVQWHPEYLPFSSGHQRIFSALIDAVPGAVTGQPLAALNA